MRQGDRNYSDDRLVCSHQETQLRQIPVESKLGYGSHLYTPQRGRRQAAERVKKGSNGQRKQTQLSVSLFRSSSDGQRKSRLAPESTLLNTPDLLLDDIPPLPPKLDDATRIETESELSHTEKIEPAQDCDGLDHLGAVEAVDHQDDKDVNGSSHSALVVHPEQFDVASLGQDENSFLTTSFDYSAADNSLTSELNDSNDFNFPSPPIHPPLHPPSPPPPPPSSLPPPLFPLPAKEKKSEFSVQEKPAGEEIVIIDCPKESDPSPLEDSSNVTLPEDSSNVILPEDSSNVILPEDSSNVTPTGQATDNESDQSLVDQSKESDPEDSTNSKPTGQMADNESDQSLVEQSQLTNDSLEQNKKEILPKEDKGSSNQHSNIASMKKLSTMFGPEFTSMNGVEHEKVRAQ
jgi:hypothetical protein